MPAQVAASPRSRLGLGHLRRAQRPVALATTTSHRPAMPAASGSLIPSYPGEVLPFSGGTVRSANWSGYAVRSKHHAISGVSGTFVVPSVPSLDLGLAATWAGIGGSGRRI